MDNPITVDVNTSGCIGQDNEVNYLEHVQAFISVNASRRGKHFVFIFARPGAFMNICN